MESTSNNLDRTLKRARFRYEWVRARRAVLGFLPVFGLIGAACALSDRPVRPLAFGLALFVVGASVLWYGRDLRRSVLPGVAAGVVPLLLVLGAEHVGHACTGPTCTSLCLAACVAGGALAGFFVGSSKALRAAGVGFWLAASSMALLTGAMACARLGIAGIGGLLVGYGVGMLPSVVRRVLGRTG
jgi:hypothetical protein